MTKKALIEKIAALEKRIAELEARPLMVIHNHHHYESQPLTNPVYPQIQPTYPWLPGVIYDGVNTCENDRLGYSITHVSPHQS